MSESSKATFWEHLDVLRAALIKIGVVTVLFSIVAFMLKDTLFAIILAPKDPGFITYRLLFGISSRVSSGAEPHFSVDLVNTGLAQQFMIHMEAAFCFGILCASPYILYQLFRFVSPALYANEREYAGKVVGGGYVMFLLGVLLSYYLVFPLTFRFLGMYQVSSEVPNMITLESYIDTLLMLSLSMGIVFEMPVLCWLFAKMGFLTAGFMRNYRKHAIVIILIVAAVITPTQDIFTLLTVSLPMWLLFEASILLVQGCSRAKTVQEC